MPGGQWVKGVKPSMKKLFQEQKPGIRVLHVTERLSIGGAEKLLVDLVAHHDPRRFALGVLIVLPRNEGTIFDEELDRWKNLVNVFYLDKEYKGLGLTGMQYKMSKIIKTFKPDIIHTHLNGIIYAILPTLFNRIPIRLHTVHLDAVNEAFIIGDRIEQVSRTMYKLLKYTGGQAAGRIKNIANDNTGQYKEYKTFHYVKESRVYKNFHLDGFFEKACLGSRLLERIYKKLKFTPVAISNSVRQSLRAIYHLDDPGMIYNGIDTKGFSASNYNNRHNEIGGGENGGRAGKPVQIVHVGRFEVSKNHELLVDAFALVLKKYPEVKLVLVGEGTYRAKIMKKVVKSNLSDRVDFLGIRKDIPAILSGSDIFVLSSILEGFGLVLVEAMVMGLPVVATNVGGIKEIVRDGVNGILAEPNDPASLSQAMEKLVKDKKLREQMGRQGIEIAGRFDIRKTVKEYYDMYYKLFSTGGKVVNNHEK
jgi:glycosyltransferase involved in cell wall biosynthesis